MTRTIEDVESDLDSCRADLEDLPARIARAERLVQMYQDDLGRLHRDRMPEYITVKEWAARHGVPTWKVRRLAKAGLLRSKPPSELMVEDVDEAPKAKRGRPRKSK